MATWFSILTGLGYICQDLSFVKQERTQYLASKQLLAVRTWARLTTNCWQQANVGGKD